MDIHCYLCGHGQSRPIFNENGIDILSCTSCGHVYSSFKQEDHYAEYWGDGETDFDLGWWDTAHREIYEQFIQKYITQNTGSLLDVGCGLGFFLKKVKETKPDWKLSGYEMSKSAVQFANEKNHLPFIHAGKVEESGIQLGTLDIITLWDVIEHIPKPQPLLKYLNSLLKPGGFVFLQTPNFPIQLFKARWKVRLRGMQKDGHYLEARDHINHYKPETMKNLSEDCGFKKCSFTILKPILAVSGKQNKIGVFLKRLYYYITLTIWKLSLGRINLNLTIFAKLEK